MDYKEKIRKLLALSGSSNEHEAKAAMLKAQKLMAEHKLSMEEVADIKKEGVKRANTDIMFTSRYTPWIRDLADVIANAYCCKMFFSHRSGKQSYRICFAGYGDDLEVCVSIFNYAVDCVKTKLAEIKREWKACGYGTDTIRYYCNSWGKGFAKGAGEALKWQAEDQEWDLVMVVPQEVKDYGKGWQTKSFNSYGGFLSGEKDGYEEGRQFSPKSRLQTA